MLALVAGVNYAKERSMKKLISWLGNRAQERTTLDGVILVGVALIFLLLQPIAKFVAYAAIAYGAWTIWKSEKND
mgnify:CR=1 FL=1